MKPTMNQTITTTEAQEKEQYTKAVEEIQESIDQDILYLLNKDDNPLAHKVKKNMSLRIAKDRDVTNEANDESMK